MVHISKSDAMGHCSEFVFALQNRKTCFAKINRNLGVAIFGSKITPAMFSEYLNFCPDTRGPSAMHLPRV